MSDERKLSKTERASIVREVIERVRDAVDDLLERDEQLDLNHLRQALDRQAKK